MTRLREPERGSWWEQQLEWMRTIPGYREEMRRRVAAAGRQAEWKLNRVYDNDFQQRAPTLEGWMERDDHGCT